jgi:C4-dicarboxylate-specific signal transduction histidine kinase
MQRYGGRNIEFRLDGSLYGIAIPAELFDSVADNLLENALNKSSQSEAFHVSVTFSAIHGGTLSVCDNGAPVPKNVARQLFEGAVNSQTGLGVGLYQSSRLAAQCGYCLTLIANSRGRVCFLLSSKSSSAAERAE